MRIAALLDAAADAFLTQAMLGWHGRAAHAKMRLLGAAAEAGRAADALPADLASPWTTLFASMGPRVTDRADLLSVGETHGSGPSRRPSGTVR